MATFTEAKRIKIKICVLGETAGKSCLIHRFVDGSFDGQHTKHKKMEKIYYKAFHLKSMQMNEKFDLEITDTTNSYIDTTNHNHMIQIKLKDIDEYCMHIKTKWITDHNVLFLLFNRLNRVSWRLTQNIHSLCLQYLSKRNINAQHIPIYIVSTSSDLYRSCNLQSIDLVTLKEVETYAAKYSTTFHFETSSKLNQNITILFEHAVTQYMELNPHLLKHNHKKQKHASLQVNSKKGPKHKKSQSLQPNQSSVLRWFRSKSVSAHRLSQTDEDNKSQPSFKPLPNVKKLNAKRQEKKEFKHLNKMYKNMSIDVKINDVQSSDDGDDIVLIETEHNMIGVATTQYNNHNNHMDVDDKKSPNMNDKAMLPSSVMKLNNVLKKEEETIYSGYLWKCGKIVKNWKLRYFIFCGDYKLKYYTSNDLETYKGTADLTPANVVSVDIDRNPSDDHININMDGDGGNGYPFVILCKNRTWKFRARSARERQQWVEMMTNVVIEAKRKIKAVKSPRTLAEAEADEDAMDIFGSSSEQYLYTLNIYQAKNIARCAQLSEPNVYINIDFNQCKSGNRYQTSIVYHCIDPVFNASFTELANKSEIDDITLTLYHRSVLDEDTSKKDEVIGRIVINMETFDAWYSWIWLPIENIRSSLQLESSETNNNYKARLDSYSDIRRHLGMIELKLEYISLDEALVAHQNKALFVYSHIIALHIDEYIAYDYREAVNCDELPAHESAFLCPTLQIQWRYNEMFCTACARKVKDNDYEYKWMESHYLYAQLRNDEKKSDLIFHVLDNEIETGKDIIGEGKILWNQLKKIEKNEMRTLKIPIFARRIIIGDKNDYLLSSQPMGYILIRIEILSKKQTLNEFYNKLLTLLWFKKLKKNQMMDQKMRFSVNEIYSILLSIGIHASDEQHNEWIQHIKEGEDENNDDDDIAISMEDVLHLLLSQKYETSVSLTHYLTAYLHFKNSAKNTIAKHTVNNILDNGWWVRFDRHPLFSPDSDDLYYMDRKTKCRIREYVPGYLKIALKLMYDGWMARISQENIVRHLNILCANKSCKFDEKSSSQMIEPFCRMHHINMNDYNPSNISQYATFNEFFTRNINITDININLNNYHLADILSPCDGKMICFAAFTDCTSFWVKGSKFNVYNLIGDKIYGIMLFNAFNKFEFDKYSLSNLNKLKEENEKIARKKRLKEFNQFFNIAIFRLSPNDYHGFHAPFNARVVDICEIEGALYCVSPIVVNRDVNVLTQNKRCCILFENSESFGYCVMIIIASFLVGSYSIKCKVGQYIKCGQLMGKFKFGGSAVILLFNKKKIKFDDDLINNSLIRTRVETQIKLHSHIATCCS